MREWEEFVSKVKVLGAEILDDIVDGKLGIEAIPTQNYMKAPQNVDDFAASVMSHN